MTATTDAAKPSGFLARLRRDQSGNTFAIFAAAIFPMVGLLGGAVDMARVYSVKTRLQAACDAGSLAARKVMGNGRWDVNSDGNRTNDATHGAGMQMFAANFADGFLGSYDPTTANPTASFVESNGTVTGRAEAAIPMVLMQILGIEKEQVTVTCTSQMKIPHTDVMFVLDVTGSMAEQLSGDSKMNGLKRAAKCFYEALARQDIDDVTPAQCYKTANPIGDLSTLTQLRFGFVPYDEQINVGRLLPNGYFVDNQNLQSRRPELETVHTWTTGATGSISGWGSWSPAVPSTGLTPNMYAPGSFTGFGFISNSTSSGVTTNQGYRVYNAGDLSTTNCNNLNTLQTSGGTGGSNTGLTGVDDETPSAPGTPTNVGTTPAAPVWPGDTQQALSYQQARTVPVRAYRYRRFNSGGTTRCYLERSNTRSYPQTQTGGTAYRPIIWTERQRVTGWTYTNVLHNVSALKAGGGDDASLAYNPSVLLPLNETSPTLALSGSSTAAPLRIVLNTPVTWNGCIEERQTVQNTDGDPFDEFSPIPDEAFDLDIDMVPDVNNDATRWKYQLRGAVWGRHNGDGVPVVEDIWRANTSGMSDVIDDSCPTAAARKMAVYRNATGATNFKAYVNALSPGGNTYHDIGLLWGARLMSPTGIFASENATTPDGQEIQRHMVFMTDGATAGNPKNYTPYGIEGWDRRRTASGTNPDAALLVNNTDARTIALCSAIKNLGNNGVTVWVVYYGTADFATTERMKNCATSRTNHFFAATNTQLLIESFNKIADSISELKLTG